MNSNKCKHGYEVDANGNHIIPKSTAELIEEAKRLLNKTEPEAPKPQTEQPINEIKRLHRLINESK